MAVVSAVPKPSYEELAALVVAQAEQIARLMARVAELEARLNQNSRNSSKPPGSDSPFVKPTSLRKKGVRRPGCPDGQPGTTLRQVADPQVTLVYEPEVCSGCGQCLAGRPQVGRERRQVFELPEIELSVTEHQLVARRCGCGQVTKALPPGYVQASVQYGPRVGAVAVALWHGQFLAKARVAQIMGEVFGASMAPGTVASLANRAAQSLGEFAEQVRTLIAAAPVAGFDETGFRVEGTLAWVHAAQTDRFSLLTVHPRRGTLAMDAMGILPAFAGVAVHDAWAPYDTYTGAGHALCGAHVLRELLAVTESGTSGSRGTKAIAQQAIDALLVLKKLAEDAHQAGESPPADRVAVHRQILRSAALIGRQAAAGRGNALLAKHHALFTRIHRRVEDYLRFVQDPRVPFDNNASEREIRMCKLRIKVSGSMRSLHGAAEFCRIRSYLQTVNKNGIGWLQALTDAMQGIPWMPTTTTA
jgi:transposase